MTRRKSKSKRIKEWGVPGRPDAAVFGGGLGTGGIPAIDGVDIDIYMSNIDTSIDGVSTGDPKFSVEITVEKDPDLAPHIRTFNSEEEAHLYARKYADFLMKVLTN